MIVLTSLQTVLPLAVWTPSTVQKLLLSVLGLVIIIAGITVIAKAGKANYAETARIGFNVFAGIVIAALGAGAISYAVFGKSLLEFFGFNVG